MHMALKNLVENCRTLSDDQCIDMPQEVVMWSGNATATDRALTVAVVRDHDIFEY